MDYTIDYERIFTNHIVIIQGVGRSGTSILGKILGSMKPTYYLFEPNIFKTIVHPTISNDILATIFEDYFVPVIRGSQLNTDPGSVRYSNNYWATSQPEVIHRRRVLKSRTDVIKYIEDEKPLFIVKLINGQAYRNVYKAIFPGCVFLHIVRNGLNVVNSSMNLGWYSDNHPTSEWVNKINGCNVPKYIPDDIQKKYAKWNPATRAAYMWRYLVNLISTSINYELLCKHPQEVVDFISETLGIEETEQTKHHIESVKQHISTEYDNNFESINESVKIEFIKTMTKLGYEV